MSILITELDQYTMPELPSCPPVMVHQETLSVLIDFCNQTLKWRIALDPINIKADQNTYDMDSPYPYAVVVVPVIAVYNGVTLAPGSGYTVDSESKSELTLTGTPASDLAGGLVVTVALRPTRTADKICERLFDDWHRAWAAGVKSRLMSQPKKRWTDLVRAAELDGEFEQGMRDAVTEINRGNTIKPIMARPKFNFAV